MGGGERWLTDPDPEIVSRLSASIRAPGINGSFQETPFEAARLALTGTGFWTPLPDGGSATRASSGMARACWSWW